MDVLIAVLEEDRLAPIAALGDVVGQVGSYDAGEPGHGLAWLRRNTPGIYILAPD